MNKNIAKAKALTKKRLRIRKTISGTNERPRLSIYRSGKHIYGQIIDDDQGKTLVATSSMAKDLKPSLAGKSALEIATAVGQALAAKALAAGITQVAFDRGGRRYAGRIQALADGARGIKAGEAEAEAGKGLQF